ncbi:MAG: flippase-like domain-containing protein [Chloroflexota bacterium]|nr:flippase-like domain-containing protein [Chloroflexota bacterium]
MNARLIMLLKVTSSVALIILLFFRVDPQNVWDALRHTDLSLLLIGMLFYLGAIASNAVKWGVLLRAQGVQAPLGSLVRHTFVGVFFNNFLPFIGADMIRGYGMVREVSNTADVAVSVVVDRLVGLLVFATAGTLSAVVAVRFVGIDEPALVVVEQMGLLLTGGLLLAFLLLLSGRLRRLVERVVARVPGLAPLEPIVTKLSAAVGSYRSRPGALLTAYGVGLTTILLANIVNWLLFVSIGSTVPMLLLFVFIFNPIIGLTMALPISISGLGVNQHIFPFLYGLVGVAENPAIAASLLLQLTIALTSLPGGLIWAAGRTQVAERSVPPAPQPSDR